MSFHLGSIGVAKVKLIAYKSTDVDASSLSIISWNIEGLSKNYLTLYNFVKQFAAKLIFLSEPQSYRCDLAPLLTPFIGSYEAHLNSEDAHDMDLPLTHPKAKGCTMILWHSSLSPYLKVLPTTSPCFVSVLLTPPGLLPSLHTAVYLPTAGRDGDWLASVVELEAHVLGYINNSVATLQLSSEEISMLQVKIRVDLPFSQQWSAGWSWLESTSQTPPTTTSQAVATAIPTWTSSSLVGEMV